MTTQRICPECGVTFVPRKSGQVYCSRLCVCSLARRSKKPACPVLHLCRQCGIFFVPKSSKDQRFCSKRCANKATGDALRRTPSTRPCIVCEGPVDYWPNRKSNKVTCSRACGNVVASRKCTGQTRSEEARRNISAGIAKSLDPTTESGRRLRKLHSDRMKVSNPSLMPGVLEKAKATKRIRGSLHVWKGERGGNGKLTVPQIMLATILGWPTEVSIATGHAPGEDGFPTNYKVDIGNVGLKIAVEVDGRGHSTDRMKTLDRKKEAKLAELGWTVLRFTNEDVTTGISDVLSAIGNVVRGLRYSTTSK